MRSRIALAVGLVAGLVAGIVPATNAQDEPSRGEGLDAPEVTELLAILESKAFRDPEFGDLRCEALEQLGRIVAEGGESFVQAAVERICAGPGGPRVRAQLALAQLERVPEEVLRQLLDSHDPEVAVWAALLLAGQPPAADGAAPPDVPVPIAPGDADGSAADVPLDPQPLLDVESELEAAVPGLDLRVGGASILTYGDDEEPRELRLERLAADLDGDGRSECCVVAVVDGGVTWSAVLRRDEARRDDADDRWRLDSIQRFDDTCNRHPSAGLEDLDGDGRAEFCIDVWSGGTPSLFAKYAYSTALRSLVCTGFSYHETPYVVRAGTVGAPVVVTRYPYKDNYGGTAIHLFGTCALEYELLRWTGREFERLGVVYVPFRD